MFSPQLEHALALINYERGDTRGKPTPVHKRTEHAGRIAGVMALDTAQTVYSELLALRGGWLFKDEADLLQGLAERLGQPVGWRHWDGHDQIEEGRWTQE